MFDDLQCLCAFIVATDTEMAGQFAFFDWKVSPASDGIDTFYETVIQRDGKPCRLLLAQMLEQGMVAATALSFKLITRFQPKYLIMTGIAAGTLYECELTGEHEYGDVLVGSVVWDYTKGKFTAADQGSIAFGNVGLIPRPSFLRLDEETERHIRAAASSADNQCRVHLGPIACGAFVVANKNVVERHVRAQLADTIGLDMESYAVMYVAQNIASPKTIPIVIKSICDFADGRKDDTYQRFAAHTSTEFAKLLVEKYLPV